MTSKRFLDWLIKLHIAAQHVSDEEGLTVLYSINDLPRNGTEEISRFGRFVWYYDLVSRGRCIYVTDYKSIFFGFSPSWSPGVNRMLHRASVIIRPEVKLGSETKFFSWAKKVSRMTGLVLVKQITDDQEKIWLSNGMRRFRKGEGWDISSIEDDQTYPEVVLDALEASFDPIELARSPIRSDVIAGRYALFEGESDLICSSSTKERLLSVFYSWIVNLQARRPEIVDESFITWHQSAFEVIINNPSVHIFFLTDLGVKKDVGVFAICRSSHAQVDVVFSFITEERGNFQRVAYGWLLERIRDLGYKWANLGGSERLSLFEFKKSLGNHRLLSASHLLLDP